MEKISLDDIVSIEKNEYLYYCLKENGEYIPIVACRPCNNRSIEIDGIRYLDDRFIKVSIKNNMIPSSILDEVIKEAINFITTRGKLVDIESDKYLEDYLNRLDQVELVKDVVCFPYDGEIDITDEVMIKLCLEKPVRNICLELSKNGIPTLMSSANNKNVISRNNDVDEERLYIGQNDDWNIGNGYAWIMLDWDMLSEENKQYLISIKNNETDLSLSESELKNLEHNCIVNNKAISQDELIKLYEYIDVPKDLVLSLNYDSKEIINQLNIPSLSIDSLYDANKQYLFGHNSLNNRSKHFRTIVIRYPIDENTKVLDVENYFNKITSKLIKNNQGKIKQYNRG